MSFLQALVYAINELESLIGSANSGVFDTEEELEKARAAVKVLNDFDYGGYALILLDPDGNILNQWEDVQEWDLVDGPAELATWLYQNDLGEL